MMVTVGALVRQRRRSQSSASVLNSMERSWCRKCPASSHRWTSSASVSGSDRSKAAAAACAWTVSRGAARWVRYRADTVARPTESVLTVVEPVQATRDDMIRHPEQSANIPGCQERRCPIGVERLPEHHCGDQRRIRAGDGREGRREVFVGCAVDRIDEYQSARLFRVAHRQGGGDDRPHRMPGYDGMLDTQFRQQGSGIVGKHLWPIGTVRRG